MCLKGGIARYYLWVEGVLPRGRFVLFVVTLAVVVVGVVLVVGIII